MDFVKALTYPFDDENWLKKLGILLLVSLGTAILGTIIPLFGAIPGAALLQGWSIETIKRVRSNHPTPLAEWDDFGGLFSKGLSPFLALVIYFIPVIIVACIMLTVWILPFLGIDSDAFASLMGMSLFVILCCGCLVVFYGIAASAVFFGGLLRYLDKPEFGTFMEFGDNLALVRNNIGDFGMFVLYLILASLIVSVASSITFGLVGLVAGPFMTYFSNHLLGQLAQKLNATSAPQV